MHDDPERARAVALRLLVGRELTARQVRERLARRGFASNAIDAAVAGLVTDGLLDDRRAAAVRARHGVAVRGRGPARVLADLQQAGVPADVARQAISELFADVDRQALIARALDRKLAAGPPGDPSRTVRRLHAYLVRLGFESGEALAALRARLGAASSETRRDE